MEFGAFDIDGGHLGVRDDNAAGVLASVEFAAHGEAGFGCGGRDQFDDDPVADERLGAPVCASASKGDPTPARIKGLDFPMRIPVSWGPIGADGDPTMMLIFVDSSDR